MSDAAAASRRSRVADHSVRQLRCRRRAHRSRLRSWPRYTYGETLGRWRTADLLIGLVYLSRKEPEEHPVADIARLGTPFAAGLAGAERAAALEELARIKRFFKYCVGLRERRPLHQRKYIKDALGLGAGPAQCPLQQHNCFFCGAGQRWWFGRPRSPRLPSSPLTRRRVPAPQPTGTS